VSQPATVGLQIGTDPTVWALAATQAAIAGATSPVAWSVVQPVAGRLVLSPGHAGSLVVSAGPSSAAAVTQPAASAGISPRGVIHAAGAEPAPGAVVYLPSGTATTAASPGQQLEMGSQVPNVEQDVVTAMTKGTSVSYPLNSGGTLVLDGATLAFVVLVQPSS
jgi:hypothetical protein